MCSATDRNKGRGEIDDISHQQMISHLRPQPIESPQSFLEDGVMTVLNQDRIGLMNAADVRWVVQKYPNTPPFLASAKAWKTGSEHGGW